MNKKTADLLKSDQPEKDLVGNALDIMGAKKKTEETKTETPKIIVGNVKSYKEHEIAVAINNFLSQNLDEKSGSYLVGENTARCMEHYGLKGHPILGLIIAVIMVTIHVFVEMLKKDKQDKEKKENGISRTR